MKKSLIILIMIIISTGFLYAEVEKHGKTYFTQEDLASYNGKEGMPQYVAVDGVVYDLTGVPAWSKGMHNGSKAGSDVSDNIVKAPHGKGVLEKREVKGFLVKSFTLKELKKYGPGSEIGHYAAIDTLVYDLTAVPPWKGGKHYKGNVSGKDLSAGILKSPHGKKVLEKLNVVGILIK
jgi:predicted heme/steroid binding protein